MKLALMLFILLGIVVSYSHSQIKASVQWAGLAIPALSLVSLSLYSTEYRNTGKHRTCVDVQRPFKIQLLSLTLRLTEDLA